MPPLVPLNDIDASFRALDIEAVFAFHPTIPAPFCPDEDIEFLLTTESIFPELIATKPPT